MVKIDFREKVDFINENLEEAKELLREPLIAKPIYQNFKYALCWSSNAIEGNTLTLSDTISVIEHDEVTSGHKFSEYMEAKRLYHAIEKFFDFEPKGITQDLILDIASEITGMERGYRNDKVFVGNLTGIIYYPPSHERVPELMGKLIKEINNVNLNVIFNFENLPEIILSLAEQHVRFERIHPFFDGNGRTGRMVLNQSLVNAGLLPMIIEPNTKYRNVFTDFDKRGDTSLMENIIYNGQIKSINEIKELADKLSTI